MHSIHLVREFHEIFGHPIATAPTTPDAKRRLLRFRLIFEELLEFGRAIGVDDLANVTQEEFDALVRTALNSFSIDETCEVNLPEAADALGDIDYVVQGSNLEFGFPAEKISAEIHEANLSKLGPDGRPIYDAAGKVVKGPNTRKPDILKILLDSAIAGR